MSSSQQWSADAKTISQVLRLVSTVVIHCTKVIIKLTLKGAIQQFSNALKGTIQQFSNALKGAIQQFSNALKGTIQQFSNALKGAI